MKISLNTNMVNKIIFGSVKTEKSTKNIVFYDFKGVALYSYSKDELLSLSSLPPLPVNTEDNLTCDGWNWNLHDLQAFVSTAEGDVNIGAVYHTTDNKTHITCKPTETYPQAQVNVTPTIAGDVTIDWGDGTTDTWASASAETKTHTYTVITDTSEYDISISCTSGTYSFASYFSGSQANNENCIYTDIMMSSSVTSIGNNCFENCYSLQSITIPSSVTSLGDYCFSQCYTLQSITIPNSVTSIGTYCFYKCSSLQLITIPSGVTSLVDYCFAQCYSLQSITIPNSVTSLGQHCLQYCLCLTNVTMSKNITSIGQMCFSSCMSLSKITIPNGITRIESNMFSNYSSLKKIYMSNSTPPTLTNRNAIPNNNTYLVIYVPSGSGAAYKSAGNWSYFSSKIFELS